MNQVYSRFISREEQRRIARVEIFDELEEWHLIQSHYAITVAVRESSPSTSSTSSSSSSSSSSSRSSSSSSSSYSPFCDMPFMALARDLGDCVDAGSADARGVGGEATHK